MNRLQLFVILVIISAMLNCSANNETSKKTIDQNNNASATTGSTNMPAPDNTAHNDRDRNSQAITPIDQLENSKDLKVTQQIRQSIMDDSSLSTNAKNVKVVTQEQVVTLRGVVNSAREKRKIESFAKQLVTSKKVNNQLEIKPGS